MDLRTLEKIGSESADRREFLKKAGKTAAAIPAVALLLSANATPAEAFGRYGRRRGHGHCKSRGNGYGHEKDKGRGHEIGRGRGHDRD